MSPLPPHLEAQLQQDLDTIRNKILEMAALDERSLARVLQAFLSMDRKLAYSVILRDQYVDELDLELDRLCQEFILRHQPAASHFRFVFAASKIVRELERVGDYAESIGRQVLKLSSMTLDIPTDQFANLANQSIPMLHNAVRAFTERNPDLARMTMANEAHVRQIRETIAQDLADWRLLGKVSFELQEILTVVARRFERVMEQALNICEEALYFATGKNVRHGTHSGFSILFVDESNACLSQMAEAIGNHLKQNRLNFLSAGLVAGVVNPYLARFLEQKGLQLATTTTRSVHQMLKPEPMQVVVALSKEAERAFSLFPTKTLRLDWVVGDPSKVSGDPAALEAAYDKAFEMLENHIQDLAKAILGDGKDEGDEAA